MGATDAFAKLNPRQREAARFDAGPLLIIAGAGTGKTNTLAHRVAHLVLQGAAPERILLLTFTRRAALEMTRRASRIVAEAHQGVRLPWSGTFHSVANRLLRKHCRRVGLAESFSVLDRGDAADLMDVVRHELGYSKTEKRFPRKDTCVAIYSHRVNTQGSLEASLKDSFPWCAEWEADLKKLFAAYVERKLSHQALDYDDLLLYWHAMMQDDALAAEIGAAWDHVLVDEYQDTNVLQAEILARLKPEGRGLTVVGDDAQSIYSFRAATVENILSFEERFSAAVVTLEENYRSTQGVLDAANALLREASRQYRKELRSAKGAGAKPRLVTVADDAAQAQQIIDIAQEKGVRLAVGHVERFNPAVRKLKEIMEEGQLGRILSIATRRVGLPSPHFRETNVVVDLAVHDLDVISFLLGEKPRVLSAVTGRLSGGPSEDYADILLLAGDVPCVMQVNWVTPIKVRTLSVVGDAGYAEMNYITQTIDLYRTQTADPNASYSEQVARFGEPERETIHRAGEEPLKAELKSFFRAIETGEEPEAGGEAGLAAVELAGEVLASLSPLAGRN